MACSCSGTGAEPLRWGSKVRAEEGGGDGCRLLVEWISIGSGGGANGPWTLRWDGLDLADRDRDRDCEWGDAFGMGGDDRFST